MANRHVEYPCYYTGEVDLDTAEVWLYPESSKITTRCPACNNLVSVNQVNKKLRKHNGVSVAPNERDLIHSFE
jgi:hypothetical protein